MRILRTIKPGAKGTQALAEEFGARLLCVRYRYDAGTNRRYTTAEIIVAEGDWTSAPSERATASPAWVRIRWDEEELRERVKAAGGRWDRERRLWALTEAEVRRLHLESRVVCVGSEEQSSTRRRPRGV